MHIYLISPSDNVAKQNSIYYFKFHEVYYIVILIRYVDII